MNTRFTVRGLSIRYLNHLTSMAMTNPATKNCCPLLETHATENNHNTDMSTGERIPVIDMENLKTNSHGRAEVVKEIGRACEEWGFFHVVNHGVDEKIIEEMWEAYRGLISYSKELSPEDKFQLELSIFPEEMREMVMSNKEAAAKFKSMVLVNRISLHFRGLNPDDGEASPALKYAPHSFRSPACRFYKALRNVGFQLLEAISESLGKPSDSIHTITGKNGAVDSAIHYYDPCQDTSTPCLMPHKDPDTLTVLLQDPHVAGLQVLKDERWIDVKPILGSLVVNVGEVVEIITNGKYKSAFHRVVSNVDKARSSIGYFLVPGEDVTIGPLPEFVAELNVPQFPRQSAQELVAKTFAPMLHLLKAN